MRGLGSWRQYETETAAASETGPQLEQRQPVALPAEAGRMPPAPPLQGPRQWPWRPRQGSGRRERRRCWHDAGQLREREAYRQCDHQQQQQRQTVWLLGRLQSSVQVPDQLQLQREIVPRQLHSLLGCPSLRDELPALRAALAAAALRLRHSEQRRWCHCRCSHQAQVVPATTPTLQARFRGAAQAALRLSCRAAPHLLRAHCAQLQLTGAAPVRAHRLEQLQWTGSLQCRSWELQFQYRCC